MRRLRRDGDGVAIAASIAMIILGVTLTLDGAEHARCVASPNCDAPTSTLRVLILSFGVICLAAGSSFLLLALWRWA